MKLQTALVAVLTLALGVCTSFAQTKNFSYIIGRNPNSQDYREAIVAARHQGLTPRINGKLLGDDWAFPIGTGGGMAQGVWPGLFEHSYTVPNCADWNAFPLNVTPSATQANLVILNNLYTGTSGLCGTGMPSILAAYQIGSNAFAGQYGNPDIAYEAASKGLKLALVEGQTAKLHILTLGSGGTVNAPISPDGVGTDGSEVVLDLTNTANTHCVAGTVHTALGSMGVYVDYNTDSGWIGTDGGKLYHVAGIFNGTPTVNWCSGVLNSGAPIGEVVALPIAGTETVFFLSNGRALFRATVNAAGTGLTGNTNTAIGAAGGAQAFMYDSDDASIYVMTNKDAGGANSGIYQVNSSTTPMTIDAELQLGLTTTLPIHLGDFDHNFWVNGPTSAGATGYACAYPNGPSGAPTLVSFQFTSGVINTTALMTGNVNIRPATPNAGTSCADVDELFDGTNDQLFVGVGAGNTTENNRITRWLITTPLSSNSATPANSVTNNPGGPSGMNADFAAASTNQTNNIYYGLTAQPTAGRCGGLTTSFNYCLVKLTQGALN